MIEIYCEKLYKYSRIEEPVSVTIPFKKGAYTKTEDMAVLQNGRCFDGKNRIKETASLGTRSLSSYGETIRGGKKKTAVLLFQIPKDQADKISGETLYAEIKDTIYSLKYK